MPTKHEIEPGDTLVKLANQYGFQAQTIWKHSANKSLREDRDDMNVLAPGDVVVIPDKREQEVSLSTGQRHRFRRRGGPALFRLQVMDYTEPRANQEYVLTVDDETYQGTTDADGVLEEYVPPTAQQGTLVIGPDSETYELKFGHLNPLFDDEDNEGFEKYTIERGDTLSEIAQGHGMTWHELYDFDGGTGTPNRDRLRSGDPDKIYPGEAILVPAKPASDKVTSAKVAGLQQRLENLGYPCEVTRELDEATRQALRKFQRGNDLSPTGEPDADTLDRLQSRYREVTAEEDSESDN